MSRHHALIKNDPRWKAARLACFDRDGYECVSCGSSEQLECDHVIRLSEAPDLAFELDNLQTLCSSCHDEKERQYATKERVNWINPRYTELSDLIDTDQQFGTGIL